MSIVWSDERKAARLAQAQPLPRARVNWWFVAAAAASVALWAAVIGLGRIVWWAYAR
jgi:hypothetical protein